ncbi:MAG: cupredoxin domain-containing protein [Nitrospira sp.]|nr:cupredoxin domain-containing protein [Nitrospira sp.]
MSRILMILAFLIGIFLASLWPASAQSAKEFTLLTALVGESANIWLPSTIIVNKGEEVKLKLRNVGDKEHGFSINVLGIKEVIKPGETKEITLKPSSDGVLYYYCHFHPGHVGGQLMIK